MVKSKVVAFHHSVTTSLPKIAPDDEDEEALLLTSVPSEFELEQNYPNPFNPSTTISFALPQAGKITLKIYNLRGQLVATLHAGALAAGRHQMVWDGKDARGANVASGIYVYRLEADGFVAKLGHLLIQLILGGVLTCQKESERRPRTPWTEKKDLSTRQIAYSKLRHRALAIPRGRRRL